jgi:glycosyltransferase involved in cell wall biosynthesis
MDPKIPLFALFTRYAYRWNVRKNRYLIVQSQWMRKEMVRLLHLPEERFIVFPPSFQPVVIPSLPVAHPPTFLFPATADAHKNFETLCEAARILEARIGKNMFRVTITVKGDENRYASWLHRKWGNIDSIDFHGLMSRGELARSYAEASCLVFPSRAETWGLPISEFLPTGKPLILADLPYAHETAAGAPRATFFPVTDSRALADIMESFLTGSLKDFKRIPIPSFQGHHTPDWDTLFHLLLVDDIRQ